jgi:hypothetical protein
MMELESSQITDLLEYFMFSYLMLRSVINYPIFLVPKLANNADLGINIAPTRVL